MIMIMRLMRTYRVNCNYYKYSIKSSSHSKKSKTQINPLSNMNYDEISLVMNTKISNKTQLPFFKAVSNVFIQRAINKFDSKKQQVQFNDEAKVKTILLNRCINVLTSNIKKLSLDELFQLIKLYIFMYLDYSIKFDQENKEKFRGQVLKTYYQLVLADKNGQHLQKHLEILKMLLKFNRKQPIINHIIRSLSQRALKKQQDYCEFLSWFEQRQQTIFYKSSLYKILERLLNIEIKQITKSQIWVKPFIMKIVINCTQKNRMYSHLILGRFLSGLKKQLSKNYIPIQEQLQYLEEMIDWLYLQAPYLIYVKQYCQSYKIFNMIIEGILKKIPTSTQRLKIQTFKTMHTQMYKVKQVIKYHQILNKTYEQLNNQILTIYIFMFRNSFLNQIQNFPINNIAEYLSIDLYLPAQIQEQFVDKLCTLVMKFPSQEDYRLNQQCLRIIQFLVQYHLKTKKLKRQIFEQLLTAADKNYKVFSLEQIFRIHHCARLLGITITNIQDFTKYQQTLFYIESNSKSFLADYSNAAVYDKIQKLREKYEDKKREGSDNDVIQKAALKILSSIWNALRISSNQTEKNNRNSVYINYLYPNYPFIKSLINLGVYQKFCKSVIKQLHKQQKFYYNSVQFEFLVEINKYLIETLEKDNANTQKILQFSFQNFKLAFQLEFVFKIILRCPRYSFLVKFAWYFLTMARSQSEKAYFRVIRLRYLYLTIIKSQKLSLFRQKPNIEVLTLYKLMFNYNILKEQKPKYPVFILQLYLHAIYHNLPLFSRTKNQSQAQRQKKAIIKLIVTCMEGLAFQFEFLIAFGLVNKNVSNLQIENYNKIGFMPRSIYKGNFSSSTFLDDYTIINCLSQPLTLQFLFRRYPDMVQPFFQNLMRVNKILFDHKLVEAANLKQRVKDMLSQKILISFRDWIKRCLRQLKNNPAVCQISVKFNIICEQHQDMVDHYIRQSLLNGNFFILQLLYLNNHRGITNQLIQSLKLIEVNQVLQFLYGNFNYFPQFIELLTNILGVSLIQKSDNQQLQMQLFQVIISNIFMNSTYNFNQVIRAITQNNQSSLYQLYTLLNLLVVRTEKYTNLDKNKIKDLINNLQLYIPELNKKILPYFQSRANKANQKKEMREMLSESESEQIELYDENRPGQYTLVGQYLQKCLKYKNIVIHNQIL